MIIHNKFLNIIANNMLHKFYYKKNILSNFLHFIFKFRKTNLINLSNIHLN